MKKKSLKYFKRAI